MSRLAISLVFVISAAMTIILMNGFISDNLGSDFIETVHIGGPRKEERYRWENVFSTGGVIFIVCFFIVSAAVIGALVLWRIVAIILRVSANR